MKKMKKEIILLGIVIISFIGVFPSIGQAWPPNLPNGQTLILVHGRGDSKGSMNTIQDWADPNVSPTYPVITWEKIYNVEYYGDKPDHPSEFNNVIQGNPGTDGSTIEQFAAAFYTWILGEIFGEQLTKEIYFICHSMGGLIIRYMVKTYMDYYGASIKGVATIGTPNHGSLTALFWSLAFPWDTSLGQCNGAFIEKINKNDETPNNAKWYTYAGDKLWSWLDWKWFDGVVTPFSSSLSGAQVNRVYSLDHTQLRQNWGVYTQIVYDFRYN